jgi:hypothetical protein
MEDEFWEAPDGNAGRPLEITAAPDPVNEEVVDPGLPESILLTEGAPDTTLKLDAAPDGPGVEFIPLWKRPLEVDNAPDALDMDSVPLAETPGEEIPLEVETPDAVNEGTVDPRLRVPGEMLLNEDATETPLEVDAAPDAPDADCVLLTNTLLDEALLAEGGWENPLEIEVDTAPDGLDADSVSLEKTPVEDALLAEGGWEMPLESEFEAAPETLGADSVPLKTALEEMPLDAVDSETPLEVNVVPGIPIDNEKDSVPLAEAPLSEGTTALDTGDWETTLDVDIVPDPILLG